MTAFASDQPHLMSRPHSTSGTANASCGMGVRRGSSQGPLELLQLELDAIEGRAPDLPSVLSPEKPVDFRSLLQKASTSPERPSRDRSSPASSQVVIACQGAAGPSHPHSPSISSTPGPQQLLQLQDSQQHQHHRAPGQSILSGATLRMTHPALLATHPLPQQPADDSSTCSTNGNRTEPEAALEWGSRASDREGGPESNGDSQPSTPQASAGPGPSRLQQSGSVGLGMTCPLPEGAEAHGATLSGAADRGAQGWRLHENPMVGSPGEPGAATPRSVRHPATDHAAPATGYEAYSYTSGVCVCHVWTCPWCGLRTCTSPLLPLIKLASLNNHLGG
jgi:hypothetical protein